MIDHPIHPPPNFMASHYDNEIPASANYVIKAVNGVFQVYESDEAVEREECLSGYSYPSFKKYIYDVNKMCSLISNGPL
jgi:hypothetical protein